MFSLSAGNKSNSTATLTALNNSLAIIEFDPTGHILHANENFCSAMGYDESEIIGKHHRIFVESDYANSTEYTNFWTKLGAGEFDEGEYKRFSKDGKEVWIRASYNPVTAKNGKVIKVVKFASDITAQKLKAVEYEGKIEAISRAQAVIEFDLDATILTANENFCGAVGYSLEEIVGRKHSTFVDATYAASDEYRHFWDRLRNGEFIAGEFKRNGKNGKEIWIQASYNPILDMNGCPIKIVKFATDVTARVKAIGEVGDALKSVSEGKLQVNVDSKFPDDLEKLRTDLNLAIGQIASTFGNIMNTTQSVGTGVREIVTASNDLASRTEKQAAALEETAVTLNQITETVQKSAEGAENTQQVVEAAKSDAQSSSEIIEKALTAMSEIENSAKEINQIISVIDDIAFQTNLLALNAGVEAARAGDAGQGFAVVASEVRALAQRSAVAAKDIKDLISKSSVQVASGSKLVGETGETFHRIADQVLEISSVVDEISEGAKSQFASLNDLNATVKDLDASTQQNAAMAEEATAACHSLNQESEELVSLINHFDIGGSGHSPAPVVTVSAPAAAQSAAPASAPVPKVVPESPARKLVSEVKTAFSGQTNGNAALQDDDWEEF
ncbi:MAG: PAS domain-containing methyl-accepting chemotaxis protein [Pseudomonadota bacterium]